MKIGFVVDDSLDRPDGVQQYVTTLGTWMAEQGHEVHYLAGKSRRKDLPNIHSLAASVNVRFNKNRLSIPLPTRKRRISRLLGNLQLDVLHVQMPYSPLLAGRIISQADNEALVGTFHILPANRLARLGTRALGLLQRRTLSKFDQVVACSPPALEFAKTHYGVGDKVVPNAVDIDRLRVSLPEKDTNSPLTVVFLGRLVERKGCQFLLHAVNELKHQKAEVPPFRVLIGGKGPLDIQLKDYVAMNGLDDTVKFAGFIDEQDKPTFLAQADLAVFPATGGESFGIVLLEAMAAGAGVTIAGNNPGYSSVMEGNGSVLFQPQGTTEFANVITRLLQHADERKKLHEWQTTLVTHYDVHAVGAELIGIYKEVIANKAQFTHN